MRSKKIKIFIVLIAFCLGVFAITLPKIITVNVNANEYNFSCVQNFDSEESLNNFQVSGNGVLSVENGELIIDNSEYSQLQLKDVQISNFALKTTFKLISGDGSFSILYNLDEQGKGHEVRVNTRQIDTANAYSYYGDYVEMVEQGTGGKACEYRAIRNNSNGEFDSKLYMFNYYQPFEKYTDGNENEYTLQLVVKDNETYFYCNDILVLKTPVFEEFAGKGIALRVDGNVSLSFSEIKISGLGLYADELLGTLDIDNSLTNEQLVILKNRVADIESAIDKVLSKTEKEGLANYNKLVKINEFIKEKFAPTITLDGEVVSSAKKGEVVELPSASATSFYGENCVVKIYVMFGDKYVKVEGRNVVLNESGSYTVKYVSHDSEGFVAEKTFEIKV